MNNQQLHCPKKYQTVILTWVNEHAQDALLSSGAQALRIFMAENCEISGLKLNVTSIHRQEK